MKHEHLPGERNSDTASGELLKRASHSARKKQTKKKKKRERKTSVQVYERKEPAEVAEKELKQLTYSAISSVALGNCAPETQSFSGSRTALGSLPSSAHHSCPSACSIYLMGMSEEFCAITEVQSSYHNIGH